jgi:hypothetical protein
MSKYAAQIGFRVLMVSVILASSSFVEAESGAMAFAGAAADGPAVVELYTSEGCSSCPPAEALLGTLAARADVVALAFHVTYWDGVLWRDRFGLAEAVARQNHYVRSLGLPSAYTPQVVVNGLVDVLGSDARGIERALTSRPRPVGLAVSITGGRATLQLPTLASACPCRLLLLGVLPEAETAVGAGENGGRTIREFSVVRAVSQLGTWDGVAGSRPALLSGMPADARSIVVLAERAPDGAIVAVGRAAVGLGPGGSSPASRP